LQRLIIPSMKLRFEILITLIATITISVTQVFGYSLSTDTLTLERVEIPNGKIHIDGLLVMPKNTDKKSIIIFIGGSGYWEIVDAYLKNPEESYGSLSRFYLEKQLMPKGYGFLYLNKRGIGRSTGKWQNSGIEDRADDVLAAINFLRSRKDVNPESIGLAGHSQGGWVAQLAASKDPRIVFSIAFAGPSMGVYQQTMTDFEYSCKCNGYSKSKTRTKRILRKTELGLGRAIGRFIGGDAGHWARLAKYKHNEALRNLKSPTLFIFGDHDILVPPKENQDHLAKIFPNGIPKQIETITIDNIDHSMHEVSAPCLSWEQSIKGPFSKKLAVNIGIWIEQVGVKN